MPPATIPGRDGGTLMINSSDPDEPVIELGITGSSEDMQVLKPVFNLTPKFYLKLNTPSIPNNLIRCNISG